MIKEIPWIESPSTKIWKATFNKENSPACLSAYLVHAPWMHPMWDYHLATLVHLRPLDDFPANFQFPEATHEFAVLALNPEQEPISLDATKFQGLQPISIAQQFISLSDDGAIEIIEKHLEFVKNGMISLDSDFRTAWKQLLLGKG